MTVELIAVSACTSDPDYAGEVARFLFSPNRLNVAMSRARTKVVLAASPGILGIIPSDYVGLDALRKFSSVVGMAGSWFEMPMS